MLATMHLTLVFRVWSPHPGILTQLASRNAGIIRLRPTSGATTGYFKQAASHWWHHTAMIYIIRRRHRPVVGMHLATRARASHRPAQTLHTLYFIYLFFLFFFVIVVGPTPILQFGSRNCTEGGHRREFGTVCGRDLILADGSSTKRYMFDDSTNIHQNLLLAKFVARNSFSLNTGESPQFRERSITSP
jgi:hypothetical protein